MHQTQKPICLCAEHGKTITSPIEKLRLEIVEEGTKAQTSKKGSIVTGKGGGTERAGTSQGNLPPNALTPISCILCENNAIYVKSLQHLKQKINNQQ